MDPNFPSLAPPTLREQRRMQLLQALAQYGSLSPAGQAELDALTAHHERVIRDQHRKSQLEEIQRLQGLNPAEQEELDAIDQRNAADLADERQELNVRAVAAGLKPPFPIAAPDPPPLPAGVLPFKKTRKTRR